MNLMLKKNVKVLKINDNFSKNVSPKHWLKSNNINSNQSL